MCQACFSDCTVSRKYVEKEMNVFDDQLQELKNLPFATVKFNSYYKRDEVVLKEDVGKTFDCSGGTKHAAGSGSAAAHGALPMASAPPVEWAQ